MRFDQAGVSAIVAVEAERGRCFCQMVGELEVRWVTGLMSYVAGIAAEVESGVTASVLRSVHSGVVAR